MKEELPPTTELEESFTNGVTLAKLANFFAPKVVPLRKIYDKDLKRYEVIFSVRMFSSFFPSNWMLATPNCLTSPSSSTLFVMVGVLNSELGAFSISILSIYFNCCVQNDSCVKSR